MLEIGLTRVSSPHRCIAIALLLLLAVASCDAADVAGWELDDSLMPERNSGCDFAVLTVDDLRKVGMQPSSKHPFVVKNFAGSWPAQERWSKSQFSSLYGAKIIRTGSESSIVHSGGQAEEQITIAEMLSFMELQRVGGANESSLRLGENFVFDTTILESIPELRDDFTVPEAFSSWDNKDREATGTVWHMLSLGPSKSGLPFHTHGQTWLAVVHGVKKWFVYPPGYDPPRDIDVTFNPMFPVSTWLEHVHGQLVQHSHPKPPITDLRFSESENKFEPQLRAAAGPLDDDSDPGYRPLECVQEPGDLVYIPNRWSHLTINLGETIAIGGQESLSDQDRFALSKRTLDQFPNNFDALRDMGLAQSNIVTDQLKQLRASVGRMQNDEGLVEFRGTLKQIDSYLQRTRDTWVILYFDSSIWGDHRRMLRNINLLAQDLHGEVDVAVVDLKGKVKREELHNTTAGAAAVMGKTGPVGTVYIADEQHKFSKLPVVKIHRGADSLVAFSSDFDREAEDHVAAAELPAFHTGDRQPDAPPPAHASEAPDFAPDVAGFEYLGSPADAHALREYVREYMRVNGLARGSVDRVPVSIKSQMQVALRSLMRALELKPLKPELRGMVGEIAGIAHDFNTMHTVLQQGAKNLQNIERNKISALSLASGYHKLAAAYLTMAMREDAIPLLRMALLVMPTFVPALFELAHVYVDMGDYSQAQRALKNLKEGIEFSATAAKRQSWKREVADLERVISRMGSRDEL